MTDLNTWKNFEDYEDTVIEQVTNQKLYLILGVTGAVTIAIIVVIYAICRKFGFPLVFGDLVLCLRRQINELRAWITGDEIVPVFKPEIIEMSTQKGSNDKTYVSIGLMRSYSWPLETLDSTLGHQSSNSLV